MYLSGKGKSISQIAENAKIVAGAVGEYGIKMERFVVKYSLLILVKILRLVIY